MSLSPTIYDSAPNLDRDPTTSKFQDVREAYRSAKQDAQARRSDPNRAVLAPLVETPWKAFATAAAVLAFLEAGTHTQQISRYIGDHFNNPGPAIIHNRQQNIDQFRHNGNMLSPKNTDGNDSGS